MKVLVIGLGSMGRRRIRLLLELNKLIEVTGVDSREDRRNQAENELGIRTYESMELAFREAYSVNAAFVCTSPLSHAEMIKECLNRGIHTFTEINLVDDEYEENINLAKNKGLVLFLSSTFMYRKEIEYIKDAVRKNTSKKSYLYHVGQYLPDWHPWENYKDFFVGNIRTNGCREIMAIEFPWLFEVFGIPVKWSVTKCKKSTLDIDYPDVFQIMFTHHYGNSGMIQIDLVSRKAVRNFECIAEDLYISWNGTPQGLKRYNFDTNEDVSVRLYDTVDKRDDYSASIIEDAYLSEIKEFLGTIAGEVTARYDFDRDKVVLSIIDDIEGIKR